MSPATSISSPTLAPIPGAPPMVPVRVTVFGNDPEQKISARGHAISVAGVANGRGGGFTSTVQLKFSGKIVLVKLIGGETSGQTMKKIEKALPPGFRLGNVTMTPTRATFEILSAP